MEVPQGTPLSRVIIESGIDLLFPCGGHGTCGKCRVKILTNTPKPGPADLQALSQEELGGGVRLACQTNVEGPMTIEVIPQFGAGVAGQILMGAQEAEVEVPSDPPVYKRFVQMQEPTLEDDAPDAERLAQAVGEWAIELDLLRELPGRLRECGYEGTAVLAEGRVVDFEPGDTQDSCYGASFDIGTTTLVGVLMHLPSGSEAAAVSRMNPLTRFGDDVLSRIQRTIESPDGLAEQHAALMDAINEMIGELAEAAGTTTGQVYEATFAGNTTMLHLVTGISPAGLGLVPFVPVIRRSLMLPADDLGLSIHRRGRAIILPVVGGFVGGDTVAGILDTRLDHTEGPSLLIDVGTNGELVVWHKGELLGASCAAGPAFEGATISHGMRATAGAIEEITFGEDVTYSVIGGGKPAGLCGSALIDLVAHLLRAGILSSQGLLLDREYLPEALPPALAERVIPGEEGASFVIAGPAESAIGRAITLTPRDVRNLQLATGAIRAGISVLLGQAGLQPADIQQCLVAGAFGNYIRPGNAQRIGLLPHQIPPENIRFVGNTSLAGARRVTLSRAERAHADTLAMATRHVELSRDPNFQMAYMEGMFFPEVD